MISWWTKRKQARRRRREIGLALRSEFELERPRGLAALLALVRDVGHLERARMTGRAPGIDDAPARASVSPRAGSRR